MKRWLGIAILFALPASASVTLTIPITTVTPTAPRGSYIRADIVNCQNPTILNSGTTIPQSQQFPLIAGSTGTTITIPDNVTQIACNGNQLSYYTFTYVANGVETILKSVELPQGVFNLANLAPLTGPPWNPGVIQGPPGPAGASTLLLTNEVVNANQVQLDLKAGTGIILNNLNGVTTITNSGGGGSASCLTPVTFSSTPVFVFASCTLSLTLTGNVASSTASGIVAGQEYRLFLVQDGTGSRNFVWPSNIITTSTINRAPNGKTTCIFTAYSDLNMYPNGACTWN